MSLPKLLAVASVAVVSAYVVSRILAEQRRTAPPDDREAELIARYRPAIERALEAGEPAGS